MGLTADKVNNRVFVDGVLDPPARGEAEVLALATEESADYIVIDDEISIKYAFNAIPRAIRINFYLLLFRRFHPLQNEAGKIPL